MNPRGNRLEPQGAVDPMPGPAVQPTIELPYRSRTMHQLMFEDLARAHIAQRHAEAEHARRVLRVVRARRAAKRAEQAAQRARRARALAVLQ